MIRAFAHRFVAEIPWLWWIIALALIAWGVLALVSCVAIVTLRALL